MFTDLLIEIRHIKEAKTVEKISIFTWCIFRVLQFYHCNQKTVLLPLHIKLKNQPMSMISQDHSAWDVRLVLSPTLAFVGTGHQ